MADSQDVAVKATPGPYNLARASWIAPLLVVGLNAVPTRLFGSVVLKEGLALFCAIAGVVAGAVALVGIRRYGRKHILAPALTGMGISGLLVLIWVTNFLAAYGRARAARGQP